MSAITAKASRKMKKYAVLTREPRCFLGSFDFSWEQRKAKELFVSTADKGYPELPVLSATQDRGMIRRDENSINIFHDKKNEAGYKRVLPGQFVIHLRSFQGGFAHSAIEGITSPAYTVFGFSEPEKHNSEYWKYVFTSKSFIQRLETVTYGIRDGRSISYEEFLTLGFVYPSKAEQTEIARYLDKLSDLITLHQRKCANLCSPSQVVFSLLFATSTFSWEQRKLGEIGSVSMCRRIFKEQTSETGDIPFYKIGTFGADPDAFISRELFEEYKSKYPYPQKGDILISASGSIGRTVEFAGNNEYFQDSNIVWLNHDERLSNPFLKCFYSVVKWAGIEGSTIKRLYNDNILNTVICMPSVPEQKRIGLFFENLDNLITLHQRECISFTGRADRLILTANKKRTTSSWEQRKFGEITSKYEDPVPTPHDGYYRLGIRSHAKGTFHSYVAKGQELETAQMHRVAAGNFIVNITFGWEHAVAITDKNDAGKLVSHRFPQFSFAEGMVPEFFRYVIVDEKFRHHLWLASPGGAGRNRVLKLDEMLNYLMRFPSRDEQIKIAEFFRHLDNLITLHQRKPFLMKWRTSDANRNQTNRLVL